MIGRIIYARLSSLAGGRIYPIAAVREDAAYPFIAYEAFDGERYSAMVSDGDIVRSRVRVHIWDDGYEDAVTLSASVRAALQRYRGSAGGFTVDDIFIVEGGEELFDDEAKAYHLVRDYEVIWRE